MIALVIPLLTLPDLALAGDDPLARAQELFETYVELERSFEPTIADLYADDAYIENTRTYPSGEERKLVFPAAQYKTLLRKAMPLAKVRGDTGSYSEVTFKAEDGRVRIEALRYSDLKAYESPIELVVGPGPDGEWLIFAEISRSVP
jgi:hypothetical protein